MNDRRGGLAILGGVKGVTKKITESTLNYLDPPPPIYDGRGNLYGYLLQALINSFKCIIVPV